MLRDGESGLGVEDEDEAERTKRSDFHSRGRSEPNPAVKTYRREQQRSFHHSARSRGGRTQRC